MHGCFETLKAFANWAAREDYAVDPGVLRAHAPKVPQQEMESYSAAQVEAMLQAATEGWPRLAILTLLGTGMRVGELCALKLEDIEDEGDAALLKIQRGKFLRPDEARAALSGRLVRLRIGAGDGQPARLFPYGVAPQADHILEPTSSQHTPMSLMCHSLRALLDRPAKGVEVVTPLRAVTEVEPQP